MTEFENKFKDKTGQNFNTYYKQYKPKLTWYLTRYTKNLETAEEFANIAFVQGLEKIDTYKPDLSQFITWLTSIAVNLVIKNYNDIKKANLISLEKEISENLTLNSFLKYDENDDEKELENENSIKCNIIKDVIYSLPNKYKKVMIMRELNKKPYKDISRSITKDYNITLTNSKYNINNHEYFHSVTITNCGDSETEIHIDNDNYFVLLPNERKKIEKNDIYDNIEINSNNTATDIKITEYTNLSTIKSQIKKGRLLIRKKVKKQFDLIDKNGIDLK